MRRVSLNARLAAETQNTAEIEVALLVFEHPSLDAPLRLSTDPTERISAEPLFYGTRSSWMGANRITDPYLFVLASAELPSDMEDTPSAATIVLENVDNDIAALMRSFTDRARVHFAVVLAGSPDLVELELRDLRLVSSQFDAGEVSLSISREPIEDEPLPTDRFTKDRFPGMFR